MQRYIEKLVEREEKTRRINILNNSDSFVYVYVRK